MNNKKYILLHFAHCSIMRHKCSDKRSDQVHLALGSGYQFQSETKNGKEIMREILIFHEKPTYNLRSGNHLTRRNIRTTHYGIETISNLGAKIWDLLPEEIKNASSLSVFKTKIKKWIPKKCPCKLCQTYIKNIGFI